jgi:hypothetical protein
MFPAFASGNDGPGCSSADSPADYSESYAVGAHDSANQIASFSSRGSTALGGLKPNISAPGVNIRSSVPGGGYGVSNGTSMATPHVSGAVALIWSAAPSLRGDVAGTRALLDQTAVDTEDLTCGGTRENNNVFGEGRLDVLAAVTLAPRAPTGTLQGTVRVNLGGSSGVVAGARLRAQGPADRTVAVEGGGAYGLVLPAGSYTVTASAFGYLSQTLEGVVVGEEVRTTHDFVLQPAPTHVIRGVVRQADGRPLSGARVSLEGTPLLSALTDQNGAYTLPAVPPGAYRVAASRGGCFERATRVLTVESDAQIDLALTRRSDYYGYFCEPRKAGFIDANNVLPLSRGQDSINVALPFGFSFYGRVYREARIASDGYLSFEPAPPATAATRPASIPDYAAPNAAIYAFWDDLVVDEAASVRTEVVGTAPHRAFVVEWRDVAFRDAGDLRVRFEVVLHEDGRIVTQYLSAGPDARQQGASATVGLEDAEGADGLQYSSHAPSLDSGAAFLYALPPSGVLEGQVIDANDGRPMGNVHLLAWNEALGVRTTYTDDQGRYRLELKVGLHALGVYAPSYGEETRAVQVAEGESVRLDVSLKSGRALLAPAALDLTAERVGWASFTLSNRGSRALSFEVTPAPAGGEEGGDPPAGDVPWLSVSPPGGTLAPGEDRGFQVTVDPSLLSPGLHVARLLVWTDAPDGHRLQVPVNFLVLPPRPIVPRKAAPATLRELRPPGAAEQKRGASGSRSPTIEATAASSSEAR